MKKIYLSALALSVASLSFGQELGKKSFEKDYLKAMKAETQQTPQTNSFKTYKKAGGDIIWSENFDGGIPVDWSVVDITANTFLWEIGSGALPTYSGLGSERDVLSDNAGNYMLLKSGVFNEGNSAANRIDMDSYFETAAIPLTNISGVSVTFKQDFITCCLINDGAGNGPEAILSVSKFSDHRVGADTKEYDIIGGIGGNERFNGEKTVNISAIAANYTGDIFLRFHIRSGISLYYWTIDDIALVESQNNDLVTSQASYQFYGAQYTRLPANHIRPASFSMASDNVGGTDQPGSRLRVSVNNGSSDVWDYSTPDTTLNSLSIDTININEDINSDGLWTPTATPLNTPYTITLDILSDSLDFTPENNTYSFPPLQITTNIMAIDDYGTDPGSVEGNDGGEYEIANQWDATVNDDLYGIEIVVGEDSRVGGFFDLAVYQVTGSRAYTELWRSGSYEITTDIPGATMTYPILDGSGNGSPLAVEADSTYLVVVHNLDGFEYASSGEGPLAGTLEGIDHTFIQGGTLNQPIPDSRFSTSTAMIRLNFDETVGINQANATTKFNVYPNPSKGIFNINLKADLSKTVNLSVKNIVGQTIVNKTINVAGKTKETISLVDYSKGVYFLTIDKKTVKVIVE